MAAPTAARSHTALPRAERGSSGLWPRRLRRTIERTAPTGPQPAATSGLALKPFMRVNRQHAIATVRRQLQRRRSPRLHMTALVAATGVSGLLASFLLLEAGLTSMALRYPLAVVLAYAVFLGLVGIWLRRFRLRERSRDEERSQHDLLDVVEIPVHRMFGRSVGRVESPGFGGGGGFAGGGSGRSWDAAAPGTRRAAALAASDSHGVSVPSKAAAASSSGFDLDDGGIWLVIAAALVLLALSVAAYLVYVAPALLAELLLDAGLAAGLYGRLSGGEQRSWLRTAVRATALPAVGAMLVLGLIGVVLQRAYPGAASIGRVIERVQDDRSHSRPSAP